MLKNYLAIMWCLVTMTVCAQNNMERFEKNNPVFNLTTDQAKNNGMLRFTVISGYREGVKPTVGNFAFNKTLDEQSGTQRFYWLNQSLEEIVSLGMAQQEQIILEVKDPAKYRYDISLGSKENWLRKNGYCVEVLFPVEAYGNFSNGIINGIRDQVAALAGVKWSIEKRTINGEENNYLIIKEN